MSASLLGRFRARFGHRCEKSGGRANRPPVATRLESLEGRILMATWKSPISTNFSVASAWSTNRVPGTGEAADITVPGANYTVTIDRAVSVASMTISSASATVNHVGQNFNLSAGTNRFVRLQSGTLKIGSLARFNIGTGQTFRYDGGTLDGVVRVNNGTVEKSTFASSATARFLFDGRGTFNGGLNAGQILTVDAPVTTPQSSVQLISAPIQNGRIELLNTRNSTLESQIKVDSTGTGTLLNGGSGLIFLNGPSVKRLLGKLNNNGGSVDFGPVTQRFAVTNGLSHVSGALIMKWIDPVNNGSDVLDVNGSVSLSGASGGRLEMRQVASIPVGRVTTIIRNDGTDAVSGSFVNAPEGAVLVFGGQQFRISYRGGDGNDVTLTRVNTASQFPDRTITNTHGNVVLLTGRVSDPDRGAIFRLSIDWGDGGPIQNITLRNADGRRLRIRHRYADPGQYNVSLSWADQFGEGNSAVMPISVGASA
ncbi:MAG: PKD domain-containing protein [Isosphaeraceae bacterium]|nr:PKD domain-containing protein [Isosphaeraceae bacterium]